MIPPYVGEEIEAPKGSIICPQSPGLVTRQSWDSHAGGWLQGCACNHSLDCSFKVSSRLPLFL